MESGASVNHQDCEGNTPVHVAIIKRRSYKTLEMIHGDFEVNAKNVKGVTCLMLAAEWEEWKKWDTEISQDVEALTQKGAEVNLTDEKGHTVVAEKERWLPEISKDVVEALMQKGADVNLKDKEGNSVLHYLGNGFCWDVSNSITIIAHLRQSFFFIFLSVTPLLIYVLFLMNTVKCFSTLLL